MATVQKSKKKKISCLIIFVIVIALLAVLIKAGLSVMSSMNLSGESYSYGEAAVKDLSTYVNISGNVSSSSTVNVTSEVLEKVAQLNVKVGDSVKKGDVVCVLDTTELQEQYDKLSASAGKAKDAENYRDTILRRNLDEAISSRTDAVNKAQQTADAAENARKQAYEQHNKLVEQYNALVAQINAADAETQETLKPQLDEMETALDKLTDQLPDLDAAAEAAQKGIQSARELADQAVQAAQDAIDAEKYTVKDDSADEQLKKLQEQIDSCTVKATADGVITQLNITEGSIPLNKNLMVIENTDSLIIRGKVSEADVLRVEEGMDCEIKTSATDDEVIGGRVKRIERIISSNEDASAGGYTVEVEIEKNSKLLIGMSASCKIVLSKKENVLGVPYDAVNGGENDGYYVFVGEAGSTPGTVHVVRKDVKIGFEGDFYTEITEGDIHEGDMILTQPPTFSMLQQLTDGMDIPDPRLS